MSPGAANGRYERRMLLLLSACMPPEGAPDVSEGFLIDPQPHPGVTAYLEQQVAAEGALEGQRSLRAWLQSLEE